MSNRTAPGFAMQSPKSADCRHSREPFDCLFACVASRRDLSDGAKLLHATLVSQHRLGRAWTQTELGERIGGSRQKVWRLTGELVAAGLLLVIRIGLGRPNQYVLVGIDQDDLDGSGGRASGGPAPGPLTRARSFYPKEQRPKNEGSTGLKGRRYKDRRCTGCGGQRAHCDRCEACMPGPHREAACYTR